MIKKDSTKKEIIHSPSSPKIKSLKIENFRGIKSFEMDKVKKINILLGRNSVGKTSILEALWVHAIGDAERLMDLDMFRGISLNPSPSIDKNLFLTPFYNLNADHTPKIVIKETNGKNIQTIINPLFDIETKDTIVSSTPEEIKIGLNQISSNDIQGYELIKTKKKKKILTARLYSDGKDLKKNINRIDKESTLR